MGEDLTISRSDVGPVVDIIKANVQATYWAYIRVSSRKQDDEGHGLDTQRAEIMKYCKAKAIPEPIFVEEVGSAGKPMISINLPGAPADKSVSPRPRMLLLLGHLCERPKVAKHLIVYRMDRLARIASEQEMLYQMLIRSLCTVHSTVEGEQAALMSNDPARVLMRQVMASFAQYERASSQMRMAAGLRSRAAQGLWIGGGIPHGYDVYQGTEDGDLVVNPEAAKAVQLIFYLKTQEGLSMDAVVRALENRFQMPGWYKMRVKRVLDNESIYRGIYIDPYDVAHKRADLVILPEDWHDWQEQNNLVPTFGIDIRLKGG